MAIAALAIVILSHVKLNMLAMKRPTGKAGKIVYKILGKPANQVYKKTPEQLQEDIQLVRQTGSWIK